MSKVLVTINRLPHQLYPSGLQARDLYPEAQNYFHNLNSDVNWEEFITTKFGLWVDTRSSTENKLHGSGRAIDSSGILLQIDKAAESDGDLTCYIFALEDAVLQIENIELIQIEK